MGHETAIAATQQAQHMHLLGQREFLQIRHTAGAVAFF